MNDARRQSLFLALGAASLAWASSSGAQTCAAPQPLFANSVISGSTCGANAFPTMNHGTIRTPGDDLVFSVFPSLYGVDSILLQGIPNEQYVFVCSGCGLNAECVAAGRTDESGTVSVPDPSDDGDYYVIVDSPDSGCGDYSISANGPLVANP